MRGLQGKGVVITGGSSGIGRATAERFLEEGARVFIGGLEADEVAETVQTLAVHGTIAGVAGEISDEPQVQRFMAAAEETWEESIFSWATRVWSRRTVFSTSGWKTGNACWR